MKLVNLTVLALITVAAAIAPALAQEAGPDSLTSAKFAADLGDGAEAERLLTSVAEDASASGARRGEALVRLGALRRGRVTVSARTTRSVRHAREVAAMSACWRSWLGPSRASRRVRPC